jgi:hypothetical protein
MLQTRLLKTYALVNLMRSNMTVTVFGSTNLQKKPATTLLVFSVSVEIGFIVHNFLVRWFCKFAAFTTYRPRHSLFELATRKMLIYLRILTIAVFSKFTNGKTQTFFRHFFTFFCNFSRESQPSMHQTRGQLWRTSSQRIRATQ